MAADPIPGQRALKAGVPCAETSSVANEGTRAISRRAVAWDPSVSVLTVGERSVTLTCAPGDNECILRTYLHLVADQREVPLSRSVVLRRDDVLVLAELLDLDDVRLEDKLVAILRLSDPEAKALRRDLLRQRVTVAALGVGLVAGLPLSGVAGASPQPAARPFAEMQTASSATDVVVDLASPTTAVTVEAPTTASTVPPADPPAVAASAPTPEQPAEAPVVAADPPAEEAEVPPPPAKPEIGYSVTYEQDPDFVPPEGVEIDSAMVIERDLPPEAPAG